MLQLEQLRNEIMENLKNTTKPKVCNVCCFLCFINILAPKTTTLNFWYYLFVK